VALHKRKTIIYPLHPSDLPVLPLNKTHPTESLEELYVLSQAVPVAPAGHIFAVNVCETIVLQNRNNRYDVGTVWEMRSKTAFWTSLINSSTLVLVTKST
jgi:hypothetical protein